MTVSVAMTPVPRPGILSIAPYIGGESKAGGNRPPMKLSSNESALGPSPAAMAAYQAVTENLHRYPDGSAVELRNAIAAREGIDAEGIVCGAGSDELLALLMRAYAGPGDEVIHTQHGFLIYSLAALGVGATPVPVPETNRTADIDAILAAVTPATKMVFLANPNNPTGTWLPKDELVRLHAGLRRDIVLVIDAAYAEYLTDNRYDSGVALVSASDNVVMTRTFSKIYGLGGLRLGWCYAPPAIADVLNRLRGPFNISSSAIAAGIAAINDGDFVAHARAHNDEWRAWTLNRLRGLGLRVDDGAGNFVLVDFGGRDVEAIRLALKDQGILVRQMGAYHLPTCLRITIGTGLEMQAVIEALSSILRDTA